MVLEGGPRSQHELAQPKMGPESTPSITRYCARAYTRAVVTINKTPYPVWTFNAGDATSVERVLERKTAALAVFDAISRNPELSGWHAEDIHHQALTADDGWLSTGWVGGHKIKALGKKVLNLPGDVDLAGFHQSTGIPFVAQVKNTREWYYPPYDAIWDLVGTAAQLEAVPVLIARRLPERTFGFMKSVGGFAFRSMKMIFKPGTDELTPIPGSV